LTGTDPEESTSVFQNVEKLAWHQLLIAVSAAVLVAALSIDFPTIDNLIAIYFSTAGVLIGIGETACRSKQSQILDASQTPAGLGPMQVTFPVRRWTWPGAILYLVAAGFVGLGLHRAVTT